MTIRKGEAWGRLGPLPAGAVLVEDDAGARRVVEAARRANRPVPPLGLAGGDLWRTMGGRPAAANVVPDGRGGFRLRGGPEGRRGGSDGGAGGAGGARGGPESGPGPDGSEGGAGGARGGPGSGPGSDRGEGGAGGTRGGPGSGPGSDRGEGGEVTVAPVDLGSVLIDGRQHWFVAHVVARRSWWHGRIVAAMNAEFLGAWDVAPRSHPNDGRLDVLDVAPALSPRDRLRAWRRLPTGTHVPHPHIRQDRVQAVQVAFDRPTPVWLDGERVGEGRRLSIRLEPDALLCAV